MYINIKVSPVMFVATHRFMFKNTQITIYMWFLNGGDIILRREVLPKKGILLEQHVPHYVRLYPGCHSGNF